MDLAKALATRGDVTVRSKDLIEAIDAAILDLANVRSDITTAMVRAHRDVDDGLTGASLAEHVTQSSVADRATAGRALAQWKGNEADARLEYRADPVRTIVEKLIHAVAGTQGLASLARRTAAQLLPISHERAEFLLKELDGSAICANPNCGKLITRVGNDRPRAGRCLPCYHWRRRHGGEERPQDQCALDVVDPLTSRASVVSSA